MLPGIYVYGNLGFSLQVVALGFWGKCPKRKRRLGEAERGRGINYSLNRYDKR
jgi:hypothetical protein